MNKARRVEYVIITPVRDEEQYVAATIRSVIDQTITPLEWIIINDGSTDRTGEIIDHYAQDFEWISAIHRTNRGFRKSGGGVIEAFNEAYKSIKHTNWEYVVKLDGDLTFEPDYFERCFEFFQRNPKLGIGGGGIYHLVNNVPVIEAAHRFHVRGATKIYRRACWLALDGLLVAPGWDTLDEVKANMLGWQTETFAELKAIHHRFTGAADGRWKNLVKNGMANYISGYHPLFMILKCLKRLFQKPYVIGSLGLFYGFVSGYAKRVHQVNDTQLIAYLRSQQLRRLMLRESIWR